MFSFLNFETPNSQLIVTTGIYIAIGIIIAFVLLYVLKFMSNRIKVEKNIKYKDGIIIRTARYREFVDPDTKLKYLLPMFGKERLPGFPSDCYAKVWGFPMFGIQKEISLLFKNDNSPVAVLPSANPYYKDFKTIKYYMKHQHNMEEKKFKQKGLFQQLENWAPIVVIVGAIGFWGYELFAQTAIYEKIGLEINRLANTIVSILENAK